LLSIYLTSSRVIITTHAQIAEQPHHKLAMSFCPLLQVVPVIFFKVLDGIVALHEGHKLILPERLEKPEVSKYAHPQERAEMAKLAQTAAAYSRNLRAFDR